MLVTRIAALAGLSMGKAQASPVPAFTQQLSLRATGRGGMSVTHRLAHRSTNQRKIRHAKRVRWAAGDRKAFA